MSHCSAATFEVVYGDTTVWRFALTTEELDFTLAGAIARFIVSNGSANLIDVSAPPVVQIDVDNFVVTVKLSAEDRAKLTPGSYSYQIKITTVGGDVFTPKGDGKGTIVVSPSL